jgi:toxin ParE1/3/4
MPKYKLVVSNAAKTDLADIYLYGLRQWGKGQSENYLEKLKAHIWRLTELPMIGVERAELLPRIRSLPIESHKLFYRVTNDTVEIVRVLHSRQDPHLHL